MNIEQLRKELELDEGCKHETYLCSQNVVTGGIGHMITMLDDVKYGKVGVEIPEEAQLIIANMMFNLGYPRLKKFVGMKAGVDARDWNKAADEMIDSNYYKQLPNRAGRLVKRMRLLHGSI